MSREIKFRAWHKNAKYMCQNATTDLLNRDYLEFMQYTGLKDKNGKEIYEGDIYKDCEGRIMTVIWKDNGFIFEYKFKRRYQGESYIDTNYIKLVDTSSRRWGGEVIGNIYENSELLKED